MRWRASPRNKPASSPDESDSNGVVLWAVGGVYRVLLDNQQQQVDAALRGRLKLEQRTGDRVVAGDRVLVELHDEDRSYAIEAVAPRKSELARKAPGRGGRFSKVLVANVDQVVLMVAATRPEPNLRMLDRMLVLAEANELPIVIVVNKIDLANLEQIRATFNDYAKAGYELVFTSVRENIRVEEVETLMCGRESVIAGPSGVGKSSILNLLQPGSELRTADVSVAVGKGQHTTVSAQLIPLFCGGFIVDTPGMREVGMWEINPDSLDTCFPEFRDLISDCKFTGSCSHTHEPGCAIRSAVADGTVSTPRYESYRDLYQEAAQDS